MLKLTCFFSSSSPEGHRLCCLKIRHCFVMNGSVFDTCLNTKAPPVTPTGSRGCLFFTQVRCFDFLSSYLPFPQESYR